MTTISASVPVGAIDVGATLRPLGLLRGDPTVHRRPGRFTRATVTPDGVGVIALRWPGPEPGVVQVATAGAGAEWLLARATGLLGGLDDVDGFAPAGPPLRDLWRRRHATRLTRTATLWHDLACTVVQQRISTVDAGDQWRRLVRDLGTPVVDPLGGPDLCAPPEAAVVAALAYHDLHGYGIERRRADTLRAAARVVPRWEHLTDGPAAAAVPALCAVPGIGPWTASTLAATTWGDPDAVILGDYGIPAAVAWCLAGERTADDARMIELLEPYRPHRFRVIRLAMANGAPPRRHPHAARRDIRGQ